MKYYEDIIEMSLEELEENYLKHSIKLNKLAEIREEEDEL